MGSVLQPDRDGSYNLIGLFNPETCLFTGTIYNLDEGFNDPFQWTVDDDTMAGPYLNNANGTVIFTTFAQHELVYIETE